MNTAQTWQTTSTSSEATLALAAQIGKRLRGGEVINLVSDLGGGKTVFVRGLAKGMGSQDAVRSPSFTLSHQYRAGRLTLHHFDFYRLAEPGIMPQQLAEVLADPQAVVAIEWAKIVGTSLPLVQLTVTIKALSESSRQLDFNYPEALNYLFPNT